MTALGPKAGERYLILAPHPDDETLAAGGLIQGAVREGACVKVLYLTNGENNLISAMLYYRRPFLRKVDLEGLGRARRREALNAASLLGLKEENLHFLGYPDLGMYPMRNTSRGAEVILELRGYLDRYRPTHIVCPDRRDGHTDHSAAHLYLEKALRHADIPFGEVCLLSYQVHRSFKTKSGRNDDSVYNVNRSETEIKRRAILCYRSQTAYRRRFLLSFARVPERFLVTRPQISNDLILQSRICIIKQY